MKPYYSILIFIASISTQAVMAESDSQKSNGWYLGLALGQSDTSVELPNHFSQNNSASSFILFGGKSITSWAGFEFCLTRTGDVSDRSGDTSNRRAGLAKANITAHGMASKFNYRATPNFSVYGKLGLAFLNYEEEYPARSSLFGENRDDWSEIVGVYGLGAQFDVTEAVKLRLSYDEFEGSLEGGAFNSTAVKAKLEQTSLGLYYQF